ncbi:hypothetical protein D9757_002649 [Collybiopsis confluens]|uniref:CCD97-like C-terminal domain-containing protein n=1 Tax=Collybiopsis confluens TaxID=2823264 RepID=A0A8H5HWN0_9AGAR|nr:hypothetical protein D9757_002649 [Collybiopsis confluens]
MQPFEEITILTYLGLEIDGSYSPSPLNQPVQFLQKHLNQLPPHLLLKFSSITTPKDRTMIPTIRNRRLEYAKYNPPELSSASARHTWPTIWPGRERRGVEEGTDEERWARTGFMEGTTKHVKRLGPLLRDYEEEREAERVRSIRRAEMMAEQDHFIPEEDDDSDGDEPGPVEGENEPEILAEFERRIHEKFIYGLLDNVDFDKIDWDESLDRDHDRDVEERWFDEEDEDGD